MKMRSALFIILLAQLGSDISLAQDNMAAWGSQAFGNSWYGINSTFGKKAMDNKLGEQASKSFTASADGHFSEYAPLQNVVGASASSSEFTFSRSTAVSERVRESVISRLIASDGSLRRTDLERSFSNNRIVGAFDRLLSTFGYSGTNVVDSLTAFYIVSWEIVNNADASNNVQGIRATHDKLLQAALNNPRLTSLSNEEKQQFAETLAYQVVLTGAAKNELIREGDTARLQQLRGQVRSAAMKLGPDPYLLKLTDQGLVPNS
jgi:hypothetical protein